MVKNIFQDFQVWVRGGDSPIRFPHTPYVLGYYLWFDDWNLLEFGLPGLVRGKQVRAGNRGLNYWIMVWAWFLGFSNLWSASSNLTDPQTHHEPMVRVGGTSMKDRILPSLLRATHGNLARTLALSNRGVGEDPGAKYSNGSLCSFSLYPHRSGPPR